MACVARTTGERVWDSDGVRFAAKPDELLIAFPERLREATLDRALAWGEGHGVRSIGCWTAGDGAAVAGTLASRGFEEGWRPHWMAGAAQRAEPDARVEAEREVPEWDAYGQALLTMVGERTVPFVAREEGRLAGFAWLHAPAEERVAGLFDVIVFEDFRRGGLGRALTAAACTHAAELGCTHVTLNATGDGERLYRSLGFRSLGHGRTWWRRLA